MKLHELFTLTTMEHRHLLFAYILVVVVQVGYLGWTALGLLRSSASSEHRQQKSATGSLRP